MIVEGGQIGMRIAVVTDGVALLHHAGGKLWIGFDVLPGHEKRRRNLEIGQDLKHPLRVSKTG